MRASSAAELGKPSAGARLRHRRIPARRQFAASGLRSAGTTAGSNSHIARLPPVAEIRKFRRARRKRRLTIAGNHFIRRFIPAANMPNHMLHEGIERDAVICGIRECDFALARQHVNVAGSRLDRRTLRITSVRERVECSRPASHESGHERAGFCRQIGFEILAKKSEQIQRGIEPASRAVVQGESDGK